jgi:hypothetical protein
VQPDDTQGIATAIRRLLTESQSVAERRRERARAFIAAHYSSAASMRSYVKAWLSRMQSRGLSPGDGARLKSPSDPNWV